MAILMNNVINKGHSRKCLPNVFYQNGEELSDPLYYSQNPNLALKTRIF